MHSVEKERAPKLSPLEVVLRESIYGNVKLPQSGLAIVTYTLRALLNAENPPELMREYLTTPLSRESAERMLLHASQAHAHYLPEGKRPVLDVEAMQGLWQNEQGVVTDVLRMINDLPTSNFGSEDYDWEKERKLALTLLDKQELPINDLRKLVGYYYEALKDPIISEKILALKKSYSLWEGRGTQKEADFSHAQGYVDLLVREYVFKKVTEDQSINRVIAKRIIKKFSGFE